MIMIEVRRRIKKTKAVGQRFLLVCFDTMDRMRGDSDLGYYYPALDDPQDVAAMVGGCQLGEWNPHDARDHCEAVIDLHDGEEPVFHDPAAWLAQQGGPLTR